MKFVADRSLAAARKLVEPANAFEPVREAASIARRSKGLIYELKGPPAEYKAGLDRTIVNGWLWLHESARLQMVHRGRCAGSALLSSKPRR